MCLLEIRLTPNGDVTSVSRMCRQRDTCEFLEADKARVLRKSTQGTIYRECYDKPNPGVIECATSGGM